MLGRLAWNLITLASLAVLGGVAYYFVREFRIVQERRATVVGLRGLAEEEGPCAALMAATSLGTDVDYDLLRNIEVLRNEFAAQALGKGDRKGQRALLSASRDGLISPMV